MKNNNYPAVSVIIPVYNAEKYLHECLNSVIKQTLHNIEIICINDGSTDKSLAILNEYKQKDNRLIVLTQENKGAGAARNLGLNISKGKYLSFLDADDFFNYTMLEKAYNKAIKNNADIIIFDTKIFDNNTKKYSEAPWRFNKNNFPNIFPFSYKDMPKSIFETFSQEAWNKIFKRDFLILNGILFQEIKDGADDIFFGWSAMICAEKIDIVDEPLLYYRIGLSSNQESNNDKSPLNFYFALKYLKNYLLKVGKYDELKDSLNNNFMSIALYILSSLKNSNNFCFLYNELKDKIISEFKIVNNNDDCFFFNEQEKILTNSCVNYLFNQRQIAQAECNRLYKELNNIHISFSYRLGRLLTWFPRKVCSFYNSIKTNGFIYTINLFIKKYLHKNNKMRL